MNEFGQSKTLCFPVLTPCTSCRRCGWASLVFGLSQETILTPVQPHESQFWEDEAKSDLLLHLQTGALRGLHKSIAHCQRLRSVRRTLGMAGSGNRQSSIRFVRGNGKGSCSKLLLGEGDGSPLRQFDTLLTPLRIRLRQLQTTASRKELDTCRNEETRRSQEQSGLLTFCRHTADPCTAHIQSLPSPSH